MLLLQVVIRLTHGFWRLRRFARSGPRPLRPLAAVLYEIYLDGRGSYIALDASFEGEPVFPHGPTGVMVSGGARIGADCVIHHQVTVGSNPLVDSRRRGCPVLGRGCYLGAGAKVIGAVTLGDNVRVGANAVVTRDVPADTVVVALPHTARRDSLDNRFYRLRSDGWWYWADATWHHDPGFESAGHAG